MKILIVDDSSEFLLITRTILERLGHQVLEASSGTQALDYSDFEMAIVDWNLSDGDGIELLERFIHADIHAKLFLTSATHPDGDTKKKLEALGVKFLHKPLSPTTIIDLFT